MSEPFKVTIYRDSWMRGEGGAKLLNPSTKRMCCLGQILCQAGVSLDDLVDHSTPSRFVRTSGTVIPQSCNLLLKKTPGYVSTADSIESDRAMQINDWQSFQSDQERETKLIPVLQKLGFEPTFVDGVAPWFTEKVNV